MDAEFIKITQGFKRRFREQSRYCTSMSHVITLIIDGDYTKDEMLDIMGQFDKLTTMKAINELYDKLKK